MNMNLGVISEQLPSYPNNVQGELRLILQTKDVFLVCYKHLEEYRRLVNEQNRLITKEFVQEQLQMGEDEIAELRMELTDAEGRLSGRLKHNELLADHLASLGFGSLETGGSARHMALVRSPGMRKNMLAQRNAGNCERPSTNMIDNISLAMAEIHQEVRTKVKPLLDYYRDLFYLQLHFSLILGQVCNYCMPLVTDNISLMDRIFFWSDRPEFEMVRKSADIGDRLKEIYTRAQTVLGILSESVRFLQSKVEMQKTLEQRFHERLDEQQKTKDKILRDVHTTKQNMDMLEEENDRLVGSLVKVDPSFVDSRHFVELAEGGANLGAKKPGSPKGTAQNNAEDQQEISRMSPARRDTQRSTTTPGRSNRRSREAATPSMLENPMEDMNNNKAMSVASEAPARLLGNRQFEQKELDALMKDVRSKIATVKTRVRESSANRNNTVGVSGRVSSVGDTTERDERSEATTPVPKDRVRRAKSRPRSKTRKVEEQEESPVRSSKPKARRRATSAERPEKTLSTKRLRPKSTIGERRVRDSEPIRKHRSERKSKTPEPVHKHEENRPSSTSTAAGDNTEQQIQPKHNLKSRLLGKTKDILEAALHRTPKTNSITEPVTRSGREHEISRSPANSEHEELNNDAVTSVSSFASLMVPDSSLGEPGFSPPLTQTKLMRKLETKNLRRQEKESRKQQKKNRKGGHVLEFDQSQLPALETETLLTESGTSEPKQYPAMANFDMPDMSQSKRHKSRRGRDKTGGNVGDFLSGVSLGPLPSSSAPSSGF